MSNIPIIKTAINNSREHIQTLSIDVLLITEAIIITSVVEDHVSAITCTETSKTMLFVSSKVIYSAYYKNYVNTNNIYNNCLLFLY